MAQNTTAVANATNQTTIKVVKNTPYVKIYGFTKEELKKAFAINSNEIAVTDAEGNKVFLVTPSKISELSVNGLSVNLEEEGNTITAKYDENEVTLLTAVNQLQKIQEIVKVLVEVHAKAQSQISYED